jgi:3'(2'), 5'-bisphosphate nucleotidase
MRVAFAFTNVINPNQFLGAATTLALEAGHEIMELRKKPLQKSHKADHSLVTNADHAADKIIRLGLRNAFPTHSILTEESGLEGPESDWVWLIDPVDGTRAYAKGVAGFSVMIGLLHQQKPVLGVVYDPLAEQLFHASCGEGSFYTYKGNKQKVSVSQRSEWNEMCVITSTGYPDARKQALSQKLSGVWRDPINSVGVKVGIVVRREADIYINHHPVHYWDTCAPQVILEEAGGVFTNEDGTPLVYDLQTDHSHHQPSLASNGTRHADLVKLLKTK